MRIWSGPADASRQREGSVALLRASLVLAPCWALVGVALSAWVFRAWAQPLPVFNPNDGPIGPDAAMSFWVGGAAMAVPLAALSAASAATGSVYLSSLRTARRAWAFWLSALAAVVAVEVVFIGVFVAPGGLLGLDLGRVNWGLLALSAAFAAAGGAMVAVILAAARGVRSAG